VFWRRRRRRWAIFSVPTSTKASATHDRLSRLFVQLCRLQRCFSGQLTYRVDTTQILSPSTLQATFVGGGRSVRGDYNFLPERDNSSIQLKYKVNNVRGVYSSLEMREHSLQALTLILTSYPSLHSSFFSYFYPSTPFPTFFLFLYDHFPLLFLNSGVKRNKTSNPMIYCSIICQISKISINFQFWKCNLNTQSVCD